MLALNYALAGLSLGAVAALSGVGLIVTYRATGVFNIAQGAVAMVMAYLFWQLAVQWHVPTVLAALIVLVVLAPAAGVVIERLIFRPLTRRSAMPAETLVATIGFTVLLTGIAFQVWGGQARPAAQLLPATAWQVGSVTVHADAVTDLGIIAAASALLGIITRRTALGTQIRAVIDRRDLAELAAVNADRVSAIGWAVGSTFAALTGMLLAPQLQLTPYGLTLLVLEIFAVPVIAGLTNVPLAILAGLAIGIGSSEMSMWSPTGALLTTWDALQSNLPVVALLCALLLRRRLVGTSDEVTATGLVAARHVGRSRLHRQVAMYAVATVALVAPVALTGQRLRDAQQIPALAVIFLSIVAVTGYSGQITLGQAGYAGLGALLFGKFSADTPQLVALLCAAIAAGIVGFATGYPAIRRRGLFLALTTFAVGAFVSQFVFEQPYFTGGVVVSRPSLFGWSLSGDRAFYCFELVILGIAFFVMTNLRSGRLGRSLVAMRDSDDGARSVGVDVRLLKVFIFTVSAAIAGVGGALLVQQNGAFSPDAFSPLESSIPWLAVVVVFGADSAAGAVVGAATVVAITALTHNTGDYEILIGVLAAFVGLLPGGVTELVRRVRDQLFAAIAVPRSAVALPTVARPEPGAVSLSASGRALVHRTLAARANR